MSDALPSHFDYLVIGTALRQSLIAAALAKAGHSVLQVDENSYYGGHQATLSLRELVEWAREHQNSSSSSKANRSKVKNVHLDILDSSDGNLTPELLKSARSFNISLSPSIVPATGPFVTALIRSGVAKYSAFKLIDAVALCDESDGSFRPAATTKEDIFKDKNMSLMDKRRLMKFVMAAVSPETDFSTEEDAIPFHQILESKYSLPPKLRDLLLYAATLTISRDTAQTGPAVRRLRKYIASNGRFGRSPFLLGQYGGVGEIIQGFCRVAAVFGAVHMLGRPIASLNIPPSEAQRVTIKFQEDEIYTANCVVSSKSEEFCDRQQSLRIMHRAIVVLSRPVRIALDSTANEDLEAKTQIENSMFVIPPEALATGQPQTPVFALLAGEGSFSAPAGQYVLYLACTSTDTAEDAKQVLEPCVQALIKAEHNGPDAHDSPLLTLYYSQEEEGSLTFSRGGNRSSVNQDEDETNRLALAEECDAAVIEAQTCFTLLTGENELFEQVEEDPDKDQDEL